MPNYKKKFKVNSIALKVFEVLEDEEWHCRGHDIKIQGVSQLAGSYKMMEILYRVYTTKSKRWE